MDDGLGVARRQAQHLMTGHALGLQPLTDAHLYRTVDMLDGGQVAKVIVVINIHPYIVAHQDICQIVKFRGRPATDRNEVVGHILKIVEYLHGSGIWYVVTLPGS